MRVGVDLHPLRPPYTGIPNYELSLLDALVGSTDGLILQGFLHYRWIDVDREFISKCFRDAEKNSEMDGSAALPQEKLRSAPPLLNRIVQNAPLAHAAVAWLRSRAFSTSVAAQRLDLFHAFMYRAPSRHPAVPTIPVIYDLSHVRYPEMHPRARIRWMRWVEEACHEAPVVHTISDFTANEIQAVFGIARDHIHVIPPAVAAVFRESVFDSRILARHNLSAGQYAVTVSTFEPRKNLKTLVLAYEGLSKAERARMPLVIVGAKGWGDSGLIQPLERLRAEGCIRMLGYISDVELATLYKGARVVLYPSLYEGFGIPIVEALASGAFVVASDAAALPEAMNGAGRLVPPLDNDAWRLELRRALEDEEFSAFDARQRRRQNALIRTWDDAAREVRVMYDRAKRS
jgi:glycosyltransferase involved in cell wall biosynthesis